MSRQKVNPGGGDRLVIESRKTVVLGKRLNSAAHAVQCGFKRLSCEVQPGQPQVIGVAKFGSPEAAGVERLQKFVVTQVGLASTSGTSRLWQTDLARRLRSANRERRDRSASQFA